MTFFFLVRVYKEPLALKKKRETTVIENIAKNPIF